MTDEPAKFSITLSPRANQVLNEVAEAYGIGRAVLARLLLSEVLLGTPREPRWNPDSKNTEVPQRTPREPPENLSGDRIKGRARASDPEKKEERILSKKEDSPTLVEQGIDPVALTAELVRTIKAACGGRHREDDPRAQQALVMRLTGHGLDPLDAGAATVEQVRETTEDVCRRWKPGMVSMVAICGPKFWQHHAKVGTPLQDEEAPKFRKFAPDERQALRMDYTDEQIDMLERGEAW